MSEPLTDTDLCALIDAELSDSIGVADDLSEDRQDNLDLYLGKAKGVLAPPETEGRSKVVSRDVLDTIEWIMPSLMRMFSGSDQVVRFEPDEDADEQGAEDATAYVSYLIHRKNDGFVLLHDAIKNCLIERIGVIKVHKDTRTEQKEENYDGVTQLDLEALQSDPEVEVVSAEPGEVDETFGPTFAVTVRRRLEVPQFLAEGVPPEEFRMARDARSVSSARFTAHVVERTLSELKSKGYDPDIVDSLALDDSYINDIEASNRREDTGISRHETDESQRKVLLVDAYILADVNGDGISELRRVVKVGTTVFENTVFDEPPFAVFSPILMPYRIIGMSFADLIADIQIIKSVLQRQVLDNVYLTNNPMRTVLDNNRVNIDDLLSPRPGGIVRVKEQGAVQDLTTPFVAAAGMSMIDYFDKVRQTRTGVSELSQGVNPESLEKSAIGSQGVATLADAAAQRIELVARVLSETGMKQLYLLMLKLVTQTPNRAQQVKINGRWLQIDPRSWKNRYDMTVSVGIGTSNKQQQIANLESIIGKQQLALPVGLATLGNIHHSLTRLTEVMGYKDAGQFWSSPPDGQPEGQQDGQEQQGDGTAEALVQAEQIKAQAAGERAQLDAQVKTQGTLSKIQSDERIAKLNAEVELLKKWLETAGGSAEALQFALSQVQLPGGQQ